MISAHGKAGNRSLQYSAENPRPRTIFNFENITHPATHGSSDGCDRQQPPPDTASEATSVAPTVMSPEDSKTMKCTLEDCDAPETCEKERKGSSHCWKAHAQTGAADLSADFNHSFLPSNDRTDVGVRKECLSSGFFKKQAISTEVIESTIRYLEMMAKYLDPASSEGSSEMKTALQLMTHLLQHRYKEFINTNEPMSAHMELESF